MTLLRWCKKEPLNVNSHLSPRFPPGTATHNPLKKIIKINDLTGNCIRLWQKMCKLMSNLKNLTISLNRARNALK